MNQIVETLIMIAVPLAVVGIVIFATKKDWFANANEKKIRQFLLFSKILVSKNLSEEKREKIDNIYNSILNAMNLVYSVYGIENIQEKKSLIIRYTISELTKYGITVDEEDKLIIEILIDNCVELLLGEKNNSPH